MTYDQMVAFYGGVSKAAKSLGVKHRQTVHNWSLLERIPARWQLKIAYQTGLKADDAARREALEMASWARKNGARRMTSREQANNRRQQKS